MRKAHLGLALLLAVTPLSAQVVPRKINAGDDRRAPIRKIGVDSVKNTRVFYHFTFSESPKDTVDLPKYMSTTVYLRDWLPDEVILPTPSIVSLSITPASVVLKQGEGQKFLATATMTDSSQVVPSVQWSATGGSIDSAGFYARGNAPGNFRVVGIAGGKADSSSVTLLPDSTVTPPPIPTGGSMFFNSTEPGCGIDPNWLVCDDFEDASWYTKNCDQANASGGLLQENGWCGTIYAESQRVAGTTRCGVGLGMKSRCAATTGVFNGAGNMADHAFPSGAGYEEVYVRFYTKPIAGYTFGAEKMVTFNDALAGGGGIKWGNLSWNCAGLATSSGRITMGFPVPQDECAGQNQNNNLTITSGNWYYYEAHMKLSTPGQADGVFELWLDNCGPSGLTCPAAPTLRMRRTNIRSDRTSVSQMIRVIWLEAWSNPASQGERYWDQVVISKAPIGMMK